MRPEAKFPYRRLPQEVTTWKAWQQAHPDTDVYTGTSASGQPISGQQGLDDMPMHVSQPALDAVVVEGQLLVI